MSWAWYDDNWSKPKVDWVSWVLATILVGGLIFGIVYVVFDIDKWAFFSGNVTPSKEL